MSQSASKAERSKALQGAIYIDRFALNDAPLNGERCDGCTGVSMAFRRCLITAATRASIAMRGMG